MKDKVTVARLSDEYIDAFKMFCYENWPGEHPLIHNEEMFRYYFRNRSDGGLNFSVAKNEDGEIIGVCGYIFANSTATPDVFISYLLSEKGSNFGIGFKLIEYIQKITRCETIACNNIRPKTRGLYEFFGYTVDIQKHFYRLNDSIKDYKMCVINEKKKPNLKEEGYVFQRLNNRMELDDYDFETLAENKPYRDRAYFEKRFFENPWIEYEIYKATDNGKTEALFVIRTFRSQHAIALRVVDFYGQQSAIAYCSSAFEQLIKERNAEFCDFYQCGIEDDILHAAGFSERVKDDPNIIPMYLEPVDFKNIDITVFYSAKKNYHVFRADGDQDRPNLGNRK